MSSKNTLPSVDLMYCQHGGEVIPSIAIERIISLRDEGIRVYLDGIDKLRKARDLMQQAGGCQYGTVAKLAMRQPFVLFKGLTFQKLCLP
ncbi:hypothetical protein LPI93_27510, partial [Klebsiella pneumoniae]|nr:hypothetical protein [Klebsiella pneumoniae]MCJ5414650.1 hypothetical protein [Klebsiella pneumoniae]MDC8484756.1 hypothetical protein [Klebsiella pneumoniae]MDC8550372.1 hypothetical protein [Klebsiella pneumoniae]MEE2267843.1 hypothetical protein [Klebsiella pneumoniae]